MALSPALRRSVNEAKNKYGRSDGKRIRPKEGRNVYRFLAPTQAQAPWVGESGKFWAELGVHWIKAEKNGKPIAVVGSRDVCYQEPCPVGTAVDLALANAHDEQSKAIFEEWKVSKNILFNVIDRTTNPDNDEVEIVELRPSAAQQVWDLMEQYDDAGQDITDLANGVDIVITRSGKGMNTEYTVNVKPGVSKPVHKDAIAKCHDLPEHIQKEFFRGDETKALNAIGQIAGIPQSKLIAIAGGAAVGTTAALTSAGTAAAKTPAAALTSTAAAVEDATETVAEVSDAELAAAVAAVEEAAPVESAPVKTAAATQAAAPAQAEVLSSAEVDDVLAELDGLIV
ncbi:hypothetical protein [Shinella zoogloeoides]|uniref:hypothetical protein n=1 Tax=Shinella zoogloeoides TaxID=352475 RepID=UPI00273FB70F|nr:hypothetical protein [Shinella zoogloeoides]WLR90873.1 hypothetical protein Q9316_00420 [Shinella zoogloeoides]